MTTENAEGFDVNKFKEEIKKDNAELFENVHQSIVSDFNSVIEKLKSNPEEEREMKVDNTTELKSEEEVLGLEAHQAKALKSLIKNVLQENTNGIVGGIKEEILSTVDRNLSEKEQKAIYSQQTRMQFPDIANKNSVLFKEAQIIYKNMSDAAKKLPDAEQIATERAALKLGVKPLDINSVNAHYAQNPTGSGGGEIKAEKHQVSPEMAKFFNVDVKKANEKLNQITR